MTVDEYAPGNGGSVQVCLARFTLLDDTSDYRAGSYLYSDRVLRAEWQRQPDGALHLVVVLLTPDLQTLQFACGGTVTLDGDQPVSWAAPDTAPAARVAVDLWSTSVVKGAAAGHYRWTVDECTAFRFDHAKLVGDEIAEPRIRATVLDEQDPFEAPREEATTSVVNGFHLAAEPMLPDWARSPHVA